MRRDEIIARIRAQEDHIRSLGVSLTFDDLRSSWVLQRALEQGVEIISEASRHIPDEVKARHPAIP